MEERLKKSVDGMDLPFQQRQGVQSVLRRSGRHWEFCGLLSGWAGTVILQYKIEGYFRYFRVWRTGEVDDLAMPTRYDRLEVLINSEGERLCKV